jgi:molybdopterin converting factor small subunit
MKVKVTLAAPLAEHIGGTRHLEAEGETVEDVLRKVTDAYERLAHLIWREGGELNPLLVVFRNHDDIRGLAGLATRVETGDEIAVISALEGG